MIGQNPFKNWYRANWLSIIGLALLAPNIIWRSQHDDRSPLLIVILLLAGFAAILASAVWHIFLFVTIRCPYCSERVAPLPSTILPPRSCRHCCRDFL
jgi:hypothetical protein